MPVEMMNIADLKVFVSVPEPSSIENIASLLRSLCLQRLVELFEQRSERGGVDRVLALFIDRRFGGLDFLEVADQDENAVVLAQEIGGQRRQLRVLAVPDVFADAVGAQAQGMAADVAGLALEVVGFQIQLVEIVAGGRRL